ncbi:MAG: hypothetical protein Kow00127_17850 [Bacteroidales bacterium]
MILEITFNPKLIESWEIVLAVTGYVTVFIALVLLYYAYRLIPVILKINLRNRLKSRGKSVPDTHEELTVTGEVAAAISTALYLYMNEHDRESTQLTIKQVQRYYTPWSSRIYNVNDYFKLK